AGGVALRSGGGLVGIAVPESLQLAVAQLVPCATTIPLAEDSQGRISRSAIGDILGAIGDNDSVVVGPGLGQSVELKNLMAVFVRENSKPTVIDADGLNNLENAWGEAPPYKEGAGELRLPDHYVLTPHPGELKRLWARWFRDEMPVERVEQAELFAQRVGGVMVLKGAGTVVSDGKRTYVNDTGNAGMATGGSGDVLAGCIGALLAMDPKVSGLDVFDAAVLGVWAHGRGGDLAVQKRSEIGLIASDLLDTLGIALTEAGS
ncbi:MAG: NAD(P)H-hydrate dehydratase, partial [Planctomycetes bacterium]|nr:NAD(P)H-hydrate dehydratase [Planctomycetota bacterium]